jgi:hypothetical protein
MMGRWFKNAISNGSFENDLTGWTKNTVGANTCSIDTTVAKDGTKSAKFVSAEADNDYIYRDILFTNGHVIYVSAATNIESYTSGSISIDTRDYGGFVNPVSVNFSSAILNSWQRKSVIKTAANGGIRVLTGSTTGGVMSFYFDSIISYDLTAEFGETRANELVAAGASGIAWCDANIAPFIIW